MTTWAELAPPPSPLEPGTGKKFHVFLSYRSVDRLWVLNLYDVLRDHGCEVFVDQVGVMPGDRLVGNLEKNLQASRFGILVWSADSVESDWVRREYEMMEGRAEDDDFDYVALKLDDAELPGFAKARVFADFSSYPDGPNGGDLLRLLYAIEGRPFSAEAARFAAEQDRLAKRSTAQVKAAIMTGDADQLVELFDDGGLAWETSSALGCTAAEGLLRLGNYDLALHMVGRLEERFPLAVRPRQLRALALARRGRGDDLQRAQRVLAELYQEEQRDPETLGIYARTWMDSYSISGNEGHLEQSRHYYAEAFERSADDYYTGINAAAKSVLLGDLDAGAAYAARVERIVGDQPTPDDYWKTATAAEAQLLQGHFDRATELYKAAVIAARQETGSHHSSWLQICRLMAKLDPTDEQRAALRRVFRHLPDCDQLV